MSVETQPKPACFIDTYYHSPRPQQAIENLASTSLETKRIPDPYYFLIDADGDLFSPSSNCKVKDIIRKDHLVGRLEAEAFNTITNWAQAAEGSIAWISPPYPGIYPTSKIIISEKEDFDGAKRIFNRAIVLDLDEKECLQFAHSLSRYALNEPILTDSNSLRAKPLVFCQSALDLMGELLEDVNFLEIIKRGEDKLAKYEALIEAEKILSGSYLSRFSLRASFNKQHLEEKVSAMMGLQSSSCPVNLISSYGTAFQIFFQNSMTIESGLNTVITSKDPDFCRNCPVCGEAINCVVRTGQSCPRCGAKKQCG